MRRPAWLVIFNGWRAALRACRVFEATPHGLWLRLAVLDFISGNYRSISTRAELTHQCSRCHIRGESVDAVSSLDARVLAYLQETPSSEMRVRFTDTGRDSVLVAQRVRPKVSPDGTKVAYTNYFQRPPAGVFLLDAKGGQATTLIEPKASSQAYGWTSDGKDIVFWHGSPVRFSLLNVSTRQQTTLLSHPNYSIEGAELSPDRKWVAFNVRRQDSQPLLIAPVRNGQAAGESEWVTIAAYEGGNRRPWWSSDSNLLFFLSDRDGTFCIWAQHLDPAFKRPIGEAFSILHLHEARRTIAETNTASFGPAVSRDAIVFGLLERTGDIWIGEKR